MGEVYTCSENVAAPVGRVVSRTDVSSRRSVWNWEPPEVMPPVPHMQRMQKLDFGDVVERFWIRRVMVIDDDVE